MPDNMTAQPPFPNRLIGAVNPMGWTGISGWAYDLDDPHHPVDLEVRINDQPCVHLVANKPRWDLTHLPYRQGYCGFELTWSQPLCPTQRHVIVLRHPVHGTTLPGSPVVIDPVLTPDQIDPLVERLGARAVAQATEQDHPGPLDEMIVFLMRQMQGLQQHRADVHGQRALRDARFRSRSDTLTTAPLHHSGSNPTGDA